MPGEQFTEEPQTPLFFLLELIQFPRQNVLRSEPQRRGCFASRAKQTLDDPRESVSLEGTFLFEICKISKAKIYLYYKFQTLCLKKVVIRTII